MSKIPYEELISMKERLEKDIIDDPGDILYWFEINGLSLINELIEYRYKSYQHG